MNNGGIHMSDEKSYTADSLQGATDFPAPNNQPLIAPEEIRLQVEALSAYYGNTLAVNKVSLSIKTNRVTAIIGPSGCGKSTFIRCLNRMHEVTPGARVEGQVLLDGQDLYGPGVDPVDVRRRVGMVFQKPNVFPSMSIHDNVAAGYKLNGVRDRRLIAEKVEKSLKNAAFWE
jgi:phosphate transport system ATP-binding protein